VNIKVSAVERLLRTPFKRAKSVYMSPFLKVGMGCEGQAEIGPFL